MAPFLTDVMLLLYEYVCDILVGLRMLTDDRHFLAPHFKKAS